MRFSGAVSELGPDDEQLALELHEEIVELGSGVDLGPGEPERADGFVDGAVGLGPGVVLGDPASVEETRRAVVAGARVDLHAEAAAYDATGPQSGRGPAGAARNLA